MYVSEFIKHFLKNFSFSHSLLLSCHFGPHKWLVSINWQRQFNLVVIWFGRTRIFSISNEMEKSRWAYYGVLFNVMLYLSTFYEFSSWQRQHSVMTKYGLEASQLSVRFHHDDIIILSWRNMFCQALKLFMSLCYDDVGIPSWRKWFITFMLLTVIFRQHNEMPKIWQVRIMHRYPTIYVAYD